MFSKIVAFGAFLAAASASLQEHGHAVSSQTVVRHEQVHIAPQHYAAADHYADNGAQYAAAEHQHEGHDTYAHPKYNFAYSVSDPHTGDHKTQHESRDGDAVQGYYNLVQPDGSVREVKYSADDHNGFNAIVHNSAPSVHPESAPAHGYQH